MERAIVFVDGNNLHNGLRELYGIERLDLEPFSWHLVENRRLVHIIYADSNFFKERNPEAYSRQQAYFSSLRSIKHGFKFQQGYFSRHTNPPTEKRADVHLAVAMVDLCHRDAFDIAYVISGDSDLQPAVEVVRRNSKRLVNVYFNKEPRISALRGHCHYFKEITRTLATAYAWMPSGVSK